MDNIRDCVAIEGEYQGVYSMAEYSEEEIRSLLEVWPNNFDIEITWTRETPVYDILDKHIFPGLLAWRRAYIQSQSSRQRSP